MTDLDPRWVRALRDQSDLSAPDAAAWAEVLVRAESGGSTGDGDPGDRLDGPGARPPRRRRPVLVAATAAAVLVAVSVGTALALRGDGGSHRLTVAGTTTTMSAPALPTGDVEADTTVLQSPDHGPALCLGGMLTSLPPQCGDVPVTNWDWAQVDGEQTVHGTTWGDFHVVGRYDGRSFTLTRRPGPARPGAVVSPVPGLPADIGTPPCPTPAGGWRITDPAKVSLEANQAFAAAAQAQPDFAGMWMNGADPAPAGLYTVAFTGDLARHQAELSRLWGGPFCVTHQDHRLADLDRARDRINADADAGTLGLHVRSSGADQVRNSLDLSFDWAPPGTAAMIEQRYGVPATVVSLLTPVSPNPAG